MIYFFYGPSDWQIQQEVNLLVSRQPDQSREKIDFEARDLEPSQFSNSLTTSDFFSSAKIIKIYNLSASKNKTQIEELLHNLNFDQNNSYIFIENKIDKKTKLFKTLKKIADQEREFPALKAWQAGKLVEQMVEDTGLKINQQNKQQLVAMLSGDLWLADQEICKLKSYQADKEITREDIDLLVKGKLDDDIFALTEMIAGGNKQQALKLLRDQIELGGNEIYLLTMIIRQFRIMIQIVSAQSAGVSDLAHNLGLHPFVIQKTLPIASRYSLAQLEEIFDRLVELDRRLKSSKVPGEVWLEKFILEL